MSRKVENQLEGEAGRGTGPFAHFREDFLASIVVFLVALPLCIGIAVAVGVSPARALLTGIIGGLLAQGLGPEQAAVLGAWLHGAAGDQIADRCGESGMIAADLLAELPATCNNLSTPGEDDA